MRYITVDTKLIGLLGTPLRQSISYLLQNRVYEEMGIDFCYLPIEVEKPDDLPDVVAGIRRMNFAGFAVTKPYKETILNYLDELDETARCMGACNTVSVCGGRLVGHNTDGIGCVRSLEREGGLALKDRRYVSFGAGGAARAVCFELAAHGAARIHLVALDGMDARLAEEINRKFPGVCTAVDAGQRAEIHAAVDQAQVLLNLSGLGMSPHLMDSPLEPESFRAEQFCYDAIYQPDKSLFLQQAEAAGCRTMNGLGMVIYQGVEQIKLWTGLDAPAELMFQTVKDLVK